jgi:3(or 17)beta-hydroxysteroid dehydrogenase
MTLLDGKVAIVTGAGHGIGRAHALELAKHGAKVVVNDLGTSVTGDGADQKAADQTVALIVERGGSAASNYDDVADYEGAGRLVAQAVDTYGKLDVLVNNAGIIAVANVEQTTLEQWRRIHAVNAEGVFLGCKHAIPAMRRAGGGSIINVSSLAALRGTPIYAAYSASKGAVRSLTKTVSLHCRQLGDPIRCNSVHPGGVETPLVRSTLQSSTGVDVGSDSAAAGALRRSLDLMQPIEVAHLIVYLASDESRYVNGEEIAIDGGLSASYELGPARSPAARD